MTLKAPILTLDRMLDLAEGHARRVLLEKHQADIMPCFLCQRADNEIGILMAPFSNRAEKHAMMLEARKFMRENRVVRYSFMTGGWAAAQPKDFKAGDDPKLMPSEDPNRIEVVIALATEGIDTKYREWTLTRGKDGKVAEMLLMERVTTMLQSPFANLLAAHA